MSDVATAVEHVLVEDADRVRTLTFNRPDKKNALTHAMYARLADAMVEAESDPNIRAILFVGAGSAFTAGNDMLDFMNAPPGMNDDDETPVIRFLRALVDAEKPLIAAVNGLAVGVGATMLLHCDLVYAADDAFLQTPFVNLALVPEAASSLLLPQRIGRARAGEMLFLSEKITAAEAVAYGLVARTFPQADLLNEARSRAVALAAKAPGAVRDTKRLISGDRDAKRARMAEEGALFAAALQSEEFREAATAFFEKRPANFDACG